MEHLGYVKKELIMGELMNREKWGVNGLCHGLDMV